MNDKHDMPRLNPRRKVAVACSVLFGTCLKLTAPTMLAVAQAAGVSSATVSRATPAVRERVKGFAVQLGYAPNPLVQALRLISVRRRYD